MIKTVTKNHASIASQNTWKTRSFLIEIDTSGRNIAVLLFNSCTKDLLTMRSWSNLAIAIHPGKKKNKKTWEPNKSPIICKGKSSEPNLQYGVPSLDFIRSVENWIYMDATKIMSNKQLLWLVVSTHLKNISQIGNLPQVGEENKKYLKPPPSSQLSGEGFQPSTVI